MFAVFIFCATVFFSVSWALPGGFTIETHHDHVPDALIQALAGRANIRFCLNFTLFRGVSIQYHNVSSAAEQAKGLAEMAGIKAIWPTSIIDVGDEKAVIVPDPQGKASVRTRRWVFPWDRNRDRPYGPHVMTQVDKLHHKGITGKGVKIAIIDSGIDYGHPLLGGCFGKGCLVSFGVDLVGDLYTGYNTPIRDDDPMDCDGHGTHVAGIVAARRNRLGFVGAAPGVRLGAYRVKGCEGSIGNDVIIAAFLEAFQDGADIITMSIGQPRGWQQGPLSSIVQRIVLHGVPCVLSAGNEGREGQFSASTMANGHHAVSVASFDGLANPVLQIQANYWTENTASRRRPGCLGALARLSFPPCAPQWSKPQPFTSMIGVPGVWGVSFQVYATSFDPIIGDDACDALPDSVPDLSNLIILVHDGGCTHARKAKNIAKKGAKYMIIWGENDDDVEPPGGGDCKKIIKGIAKVPSTIGQTWTRLVAGGHKVVAQIPDTSRGGKIVNKENKATGGALSVSSTWGPTFDLEFEPRFGAPGKHILSTYPRALGGFAILSGTSMACPLVAAIYALVHEARQGRAGPFSITDFLSNTAKPATLNLGGHFHDYIAPISQQGSGLLQAYKAAYASTFISPSILSFNDSDHAPERLKFTISNRSRAAIKYTLGNKPSVTAYTLPKDSIYPMRHKDELIAAYATLSFTWNNVPARRFTLQSGQRAVIEVAAQPPRLLEKTRLPVWSGYITIDGTDGSSYSVAYLGLVGSLRNAVVLAPDQAWIFAPIHGSDYPREPDDTTFIIPAQGRPNDNGDATYPAVHVKLALGTSLLYAHIIPLQGEDELEAIGQHAMFPKRWVPRGVTYQKWDGKLNSGTYAPPGRYKIRIKALRIFGCSSKEEDWDTATTQPFILQYK